MPECRVRPGGTCSLCTEIPPATVSDYTFITYNPIMKENTMGSVAITRNTTEQRDIVKRRAERKLKNMETDKNYLTTRVEVSTHVYADDPYASLYVQVPPQGDGDSDGQYVAISLNREDLLNLELELFKAREKVAAAIVKKEKRAADMLKRF